MKENTSRKQIIKHSIILILLGITSCYVMVKIGIYANRHFQLEQIPTILDRLQGEGNNQEEKL